MGLFDSSSSASQSTQTASGSGQLAGGKDSQIGTLNVGAKGKYNETGTLDLSSSKSANLGTSYSTTGLGNIVTVTNQSLDTQVVSDALNVVKDLQTQSAQTVAASTAAIKATNDNLVSLLGGTPAPTSSIDSTTLIKWAKWAGIGVAALAVLYFLFRKT